MCLVVAFMFLYVHQPQLKKGYKQTYFIRGLSCANTHVESSRYIWASWCVRVRKRIWIKQQLKILAMRRRQHLFLIVLLFFLLLLLLLHHTFVVVVAISYQDIFFSQSDIPWFSRGYSSLRYFSRWRRRRRGHHNRAPPLHHTTENVIDVCVCVVLHYTDAQCTAYDLLQKHCTTCGVSCFFFCSHKNTKAI